MKVNQKSMDLSAVVQMMVEKGAKRFYLKTLSENDNSKNQPYVGGHEAIKLFPAGNLVPVQGAVRQNFRVPLRFAWLADDGSVADAPNTKLIYYPDYPEVRLSGFLLGCRKAPSALMSIRQAGRVLVMGIIPPSESASTDDLSDEEEDLSDTDNEPKGSVIAFVAAPDSELAREFTALGSLAQAGVFSLLQAPEGTTPNAALLHVQKLLPTSAQLATKVELCRELLRIHELGWINSKRLINAVSGATANCNSPNCGGYTLEAELGITANGRSDPDWRGWEVKQYGVRDFSRYIAKSAVSVMVPNADGGYRIDQGFTAFMARYGYPDKTGRQNRTNFGGQFYADKTVSNRTVPLTMIIDGFDQINVSITNAEGGVCLIEADGTVALRWSFGKILGQWSHKHDHAVYIPSMTQDNPSRQYQYGGRILICEMTSPILLLKAFAEGKIFLDPGLKLDINDSRAVHKERHQFRIKQNLLSTLYHSATYEYL
jgi:hypothetical protein